MTLQLVKEVHRRLSEVIQPGDICLDVTAGNGFDTLFLSQHVGPSGRVHSIDVQSDALANTKNLLDHKGIAERLITHLSCHSRMETVLPSSAKGEIRAITFNLGYLPKGDKSITTNEKTTLSAVDKAFGWLKDRGVLSVLCYVGHPGGKKEEKTVRQLIKERGWKNEIIAGSDSGESPLLHWIEKT